MIFVVEKIVVGEKDVRAIDSGQFLDHFADRSPTQAGPIKRVDRAEIAGVSTAATELDQSDRPVTLSAKDASIDPAV